MMAVDTAAPGEYEERPLPPSLLLLRFTAAMAVSPGDQQQRRRVIECTREGDPSEEAAQVERLQQEGDPQTSITLNVRRFADYKNICVACVAVAAENESFS